MSCFLCLLMHNFIANLLTQIKFEMINNTFIEFTIEESFYVSLSRLRTPNQTTNRCRKIKE